MRSRKYISLRMICALPQQISSAQCGMAGNLFESNDCLDTASKVEQFSYVQWCHNWEVWRILHVCNGVFI
jgi:hypothetical protein